jgi:hypothetical protein
MTPATSPRRPAKMAAAPSLPEFLAPRSLAAVRELAQRIACAEWAPETYRDFEGTYSVAKIELAIMQGAVVGLGPIASVQSIALIDGKPAIWGDGALAVVEGSGLLDDMSEEYVTDDEEGLTAISTLRRRHRPTPIVGRFSIAMAEQAQLTQKEGPWRSYPRRMLMMRARSWALRDGFADVLRGLAIREEVEDYEPGERGASSPSARVSPSALRTPVRAWLPRPRFSASITVPDRAANQDTAPADAAEADPPATGAEMHGEADEVAVIDKLEPPEAVKGVALVATEELSAEPGASVREGEGDTRDAAHAPEDLFSLTDAEGDTIEVAGIAALGETFGHLMADRHLSRDQILGLWESNKGARRLIEQEFGPEALEDAADRVRIAGPVLKKPIGLTRQPPLRRRSDTPSTRRPAQPERSEFELALEISPAWSEARVAKLYLERLAKLKKGSGPAAELARFREANRSIEERLRASVPHLMVPIDALYAWAATHAR